MMQRSVVETVMRTLHEMAKLEPGVLNLSGAFMDYFKLWVLSDTSLMTSNDKTLGTINCYFNNWVLSKTLQV
jgi:hypothetical protein